MSNEIHLNVDYKTMKHKNNKGICVKPKQQQEQQKCDVLLIKREKKNCAIIIG